MCEETPTEACLFVGGPLDGDVKHIERSFARGTVSIPVHPACDTQPTITQEVYNWEVIAIGARITFGFYVWEKIRIEQALQLMLEWYSKKHENHS
jgi:hypothetical protein